MPFATDHELAAGAGRRYGEYLTTIMSATSRARADIYRRGDKVRVHIMIPEGSKLSDIKDPFERDFIKYAHEQGYPTEALQVSYYPE